MSKTESELILIVVLVQNCVCFSQGFGLIVVDLRQIIVVEEGRLRVSACSC